MHAKFLHATLLTRVIFQRTALTAVLSIWLGLQYVDKPNHLSQDSRYLDAHICKQNF